MATQFNGSQLLAGSGIPSTGQSVGTPSFNPSAQQVSNYSTAGDGTKIAEAANKLATSQSYGDFDNLTPEYNIQDNQLTDAGTNQPLATLGESTSPAPAGGADLLVKDPLDTAAHKVTITQEPKTGDDIDVVFDVSPTIQESGSVSYMPMDLIHHPGEIMKYKNTAARSWSISARLISRNSAEATRNMKMINIIRAWRMPFYGEGTNKDFASYLGAPPPILTLSAYGAMVIGPVKCVLESYDWTWPNDVDYIPALDETAGEYRPWPVIIDVSLSMKESWSPAEYSGFSLKDYRLGKMPEAFKSISPVGQGSNQATATSENRGTRGGA